MAADSQQSSAWSVDIHTFADGQLTGQGDGLARQLWGEDDFVPVALELVSPLNLKVPNWVSCKESSNLGQDFNLLGMLFSRLTWPSPIVRERACVETAQLLLASTVGDKVRAYFSKWLAAQHHESVCSLAVLPLLRAKTESGGSCVIPIENVQADLSFSSLQSLILLQEYEPNKAAQTDLRQMHSETAPPSFNPNPFFQKYVTAFLPPIYDFRAKWLETHGSFGYQRQWAFEWQVVLDRDGIDLSTDPLSFWLGNRSSDARCIGADMPLSEVYHSAYLRALAWAVDSCGLKRDIANQLAAETIPIDLDLWRTRPQSRPNWWPHLSDRNSAVETAPGELHQSVSNLWESQQNGKAPWGRDWFLVEASGHVHGGPTIYDLSIIGCFQRRFDVGDPDPKDLIEWCLTEDRQCETMSPSGSLLRFEGFIHPREANRIAREFSGSSFVPAASRLQRGGTIDRWHWWRGLRGLWTPTSCLTSSGFQVKCEDQFITFASDGDIVAQWSDWTEALREWLARGLKPATGQFLLVRKSVIEQFLERTGSTFCWLVQQFGSFQKHGYGDFEHFTYEQAYGISGLVMP